MIIITAKKEISAPTSLAPTQPRRTSFYGKRIRKFNLDNLSNKNLKIGLRFFERGWLQRLSKFIQFKKFKIKLIYK